MKTVIISLFISFIALSCSFTDSDIEPEKSSKTSFEQFVDSIPLIKLPFELSTSDEMEQIAMSSNYIPEGAALVGKLKSKAGTHYIIYSYPGDIRLPILEVYNSTGEKTHEVVLFAYGSCPITSSGYSRFMINRYDTIYMETACDAYDSRIDQDTIVLESLLTKDRLLK